MNAIVQEVQEETEYELKEAALPPRILVVDDDTLIREFNSLLLRNSGYEVDVAEDGLAGWNALQESRYDLVMTDHEMPSMTGMELIERIRSAGIQIPVILSSGSIDLDELEPEQKERITALLPKPFSFSQLLETVARLLSVSAV